MKSYMRYRLSKLVLFLKRQSCQGRKDTETVINWSKIILNQWQKGAKVLWPRGSKNQTFKELSQTVEFLVVLFNK